MKNVEEYENALAGYPVDKRAIIEHCLGYCYENGIGGVNLDPHMAFMHYERAFVLNPKHADYARSLSNCYKRGFGVKPSSALGHYYHELEDAIIFGKAKPKKP